MSTMQLTPLMAQYHKLKNQYSDGILFFQVGDFYETFYEDAETVSEILNIALTSRDKKNPVPLAGVPIHAKDPYIAKLLNAGKKVVICDQVEDASQSKGLVRREITDIITPGTSMSPSTLKSNEKNYIVAITGDGRMVGTAFMDISTGEFLAGQDKTDYMENILSITNVREAIYPEKFEETGRMILKGNPRCTLSDSDP